jgi:peptidoglycan/xylan/chitin deacetylase (PgdA/CDA1 family)
MDVGGHTRNHPILGRVTSPETLRDEIAGCRDDLIEALGRKPLAFAYPVGSEEAMSTPADSEIRLAGFKASFSYLHGYAPRRPSGASRLPRLHSEYGQNFRAFRLGTACAPIRR